MKINHLLKTQKYHQKLIAKKNKPVSLSNGVFERFKNPVLTAQHIPLHWRYDLDIKTNPLMMERIGFNVTFNAGAMKWKGNYVLAVRVAFLAHRIVYCYYG